MTTKSKFYKLTVKNIIQETEDCVSISFSVPDKDKNDFNYHSGQYLTFKAHLKNEEVRRSYSLCSEPSSGTYKVAIKKIENGLFSNYAHQVIKEGDVLEVMKPSGNFQHIPDHKAKKNYVLYAAGSGITPILSILKSILYHEPKSNVNLIYGNKAALSIIFKEEIEALKNTYLDRLSIIHILSRENLGNALQKGRIDKKKCALIYDTYLTGITIDDVFICGPEQMTLDIRETLISKGLDTKKIHLELFGTGHNKKESKNQSISKREDDSAIVLHMDGDEFEFALNNQGVSILDAAQKSGLDVPYACKGGVCCTCKAKVLEGTVTMDVNYALEQDELKKGYILTCQAHPTSNKVIVTFDE